MKKIIVLIATLISSLSVFTQDLTGQWNGTIQIHGMELRLVFRISNADGQYHASLDSPNEGVLGVPLGAINYENQVLSIDMPSISAKFQGTYVQGEKVLKGNFFKNGQLFPLNLSRDVPREKVLYRPQEPVQPYPYYTEEVKFPSEQGTIELAGTLTLPKQKGNFPAVILISGSGPQDRNEESATHKPFLVLADHLTRQGIAVLRYDDRGFAQSTGNYEVATSRDFAHDVMAALDYLKARDEIDKTHIGLIGHSEGGLIASMVASESADVNFIVLLASPGVPGDQILLQQMEKVSQLEGIHDTVIQREVLMMTEAFNLVKHTKDEEVLAQELRAHFTKMAAISGVIPEGMSEQYFINLCKTTYQALAQILFDV